MNRLVVVSNRVSPVRRAKSGAHGGLTVAVTAAMSERGGMWFGWSGRVYEHEPGAPDIFAVGNLTCALVDLSQRDYEEYYNGYANRTLWPLFHYRLDLGEFSRRNLSGYQRVNAFFANRLRALLRPDDLVWVHDYHLIPMGEQLRAAGCKQRIGFFLHIPWPASEVLIALPNHAALVRSLCAYDLIGFQTETDRRAFFDYIEIEAKGRVRADGQVEAFGYRLRAGVFPISIDTEDVTRFAAEAESSPQNKRLSDSLDGRALMIGVDRLDYSKGLVARLRAVDRLLKTYPANRGRVVTLQIAPRSRADVPEYMEIRRQLESIVGRVNGTYAEYDWVPIRYLNKSFRRQTLAGFYRISRVGLVTPLRDGMNLVAKEFVAAQNGADPGVLILSRFAGAAQELKGALIVNPYDVESVAEAMQTALTMPLGERQERWSKMFAHLCEYDVSAWQRSFLADLAAASLRSAA